MADPINDKEVIEEIEVLAKVIQEAGDRIGELCGDDERPPQV